MLVSRQEAIDLLHKWLDECTPVTALLVSSDPSVTVKVTGFVNGLSSNILISDGSRDVKVRPKNYILFPAHFIESFQYIEARELADALSLDELQQITKKPEFASLSLTYKSGSRISIFER